MWRGKRFWQLMVRKTLKCFFMYKAEVNNSLHLAFDPLLDLATPSPHIDPNAGELRRRAGSFA